MDYSFSLSGWKTSEIEYYPRKQKSDIFASLLATVAHNRGSKRKEFFDSDLVDTEVNVCSDSPVLP